MKPQHTRGGVCLVIGLAGALALAGCSADAGSETGGGTSTLSIGSTVVPQSWDPADIGDANYKPYAQAAYDTLVLREPDGEYVPMLAEAWSFSDDNRTLTLELRDDVTFSDGEEFDADAVVANFEHFAEGTGPLSTQLAGLESAEAVSEFTVEAEFAQPIPDLVYNLSDAAGRMASPASLGEDGLETVPVGTGPYVMDESNTVQGSTYALTAREDYWNSDLQEFETIEFQIFEDESALINALRSGQVDAGNLTNPDNVESAKAAGISVLKPDVHISWFGLIVFDREGTMVPELADPRVREALAWAIDRETLAKVTLGIDDGTIDDQMFNEGSPAWGSELAEHYSYDPDRARELLDEAGVDGFTIHMPVSSLFQQGLLTGVEEQLGAVGIEVVWDDVPGQSFIDEMLGGNYPVSLMVLGSVPTDWSVVTNYLAPDSAWNPLGTSDPELQALIDAIPAQSDDERGASYQAINEFVIENNWFQPWFWAEENFAVNEDAVHVELQLQQNVPSIYNYSPAS
ncbi:ABC transporter substrate-binding protein [Microbacterium halotolerans]|uniref:ABC transporter substrate-binding protein n=1 Tax=Microbacterium halotolerans TaxID=246613 RepID=UPI0013C308C2|nr:ABC transporter substrate-binding protein [Microbacterium halotolerans]